MLRVRIVAIFGSLGVLVVCLGGCAMTGGAQSSHRGSHDALEARVASEVRALHAFFELWLKGEVPDTDEVLARFSDAIDDDFTLVTTDGALLDRAGIIAWVRDNHGSRPRFRLWTERPRLIRALPGGSLIAQYEEWQTIEGVTRGRVSTAVFKPDADAPGGLRWIRVHETWLPEGATP